MVDEREDEAKESERETKDVGEGTPLDLGTGYGISAPVTEAPQTEEKPSAPAEEAAAAEEEAPAESAAPARDEAAEEQKEEPEGEKKPPAPKGPESVDYGATFKPLKEGDVVRGTVVHIDKEGILVDIGTKSEGLVPPKEISRRQAPIEEAVSVGDEIDVYVMRTDDEEEGLVLSKKRADFEKAWERILDAHDKGRTIQAMVTDRVKGGLVVDLGLRGFVPASHAGMGRPQNLDKLVGQSLTLRVIEVDRDRRKVILSHRLALDEERRKLREHTLEDLKEGQIRDGIVRRLTNYGAFVDLGGIDGLLHISEMSWTRIKHPSDVLRVGDKIQVAILKLNLEQNRISLGMRQILPDPWSDVHDHFEVGEVVEGTVSRLVPFGAFVQLETGIEGIVPNIELAEKRVTKPEQVVSVGDTVNVKILDIRAEERRMTLSLREAPQPEPLEPVEEEPPEVVEEPEEEESAFGEPEPERGLEPEPEVEKEPEPAQQSEEPVAGAGDAEAEPVSQEEPPLDEGASAELAPGDAPETSREESAGEPDSMQRE